MYNATQNCSVDVEQEVEPHCAYYITSSQNGQGQRCAEIFRPEHGNYSALSESCYFFTPSHYESCYSAHEFWYWLVINVLRRFSASLSFLLTQLFFLLNTLTTKKKKKTSSVAVSACIASQWQFRRGIWLSSSLQLESLKTGTAAQASGMAAHYFKEAPKRAHFLLREYASHLNNQSQAASFTNYVIVAACSIISLRTFSSLAY